MPASAVVRAAGGVLWRPDPRSAGEVEVALVHRPRYDDWSLPKGKLQDGEPALAGALREVLEETGFSGVAGRTLGSSAYHVLLDGREVPKTVRWWAVRAAAGAFAPNDEVDELRWLPPAAACDLLTAGRDVAPLELLLSGGLATTTVLLVRHGRAGDRASWSGQDLLRPLDERGRRQADALADLLPAYAPVRVLSAPAARCVQTVTPFATRAGLAVEVAPELGEQGFADDPDASLSLLRSLGASAGCTVACSQGGAVPELVAGLSQEAGLALRSTRAKKGAMWALTFSSAGALVDADLVPPLA